MSWKQVLDLVWNLVNSGAGIAVLAAILLYGLNKLWAAKPKWKVYYDKYQGSLISAVKEVEQLAEASGREKLEKALELVVEVLERASGSAATPADKVAIKEALSKVHDDLEKAGTIPNGFTEK